MRGAPLCLLLCGCGLELFSSNQEEGCLDGMVAIAGGAYTIGEQHPGQPWHEPATGIELQDFCIDTYEYPGKEGEMPRGDVTWDDADALCKEAGKRLCTSYEWERTCRGPERNRYSYGSERDATACNTPVDGSGPGRSPAPIQPSGTYERCKSAEGVYDLNGSLSEWVSDPWTGQPEPFNAEETVDPATWRMLRGGTMWDKTFYGQDCTSRHGHKIAFKNMDDGFRCCKDGA